MAYSKEFNDAFSKAMRWEVGPHFDANDPETQAGLCSTKAQKFKTGYTNLKSDKGGETKFGWSKTSHPNDNIKTITLDFIKDKYKLMYWDTVSGDKLDPYVAKYVFDTSVLFGPDRARKFLQQAVGVDADGIIGPKTLKAASAMNPRDLVLAMRKLRLISHIAQAAKPGQSGFLAGWTRRANEVD